MHLNDSSSIALHLKTHSISKSKFRKIIVENTTIITHEINKLRQDTYQETWEDLNKIIETKCVFII